MAQDIDNQKSLIAEPSDLVAFLVESRDAIAKEWLVQVKTQIPASLTETDDAIIDSLPTYLVEVSNAIAGFETDAAIAPFVTTAREHGRSRTKMRYTIRDVATEYTILREIVFTLGTSAQKITAASFFSFSRVNDTGSINAVEEFSEETRLRREQQYSQSGMAKSSEAYFEKLLDASPAMVWITDRNSSCTYLSKQWYEFTGRTSKQDLGVGWLENIHPDDLPETARVYANAVSNRGVLRVDYRLRKKTGEYRWAVDIGYPRFKDDGTFDGYIGTVTDIHDRIAAEKNLEAIQERFTRSAAATDLGVWYCDLPFSELIWNREVKNHFFLPPNARVTIETFYERIHPDDRELTRRAIATSIENHSAYDIVYRTTDPFGLSEIKYIRAIGWTDYDANGKPIRFDGITLDVSDQIRTQKELSEAKFAAERANSAKSAFLANMSHEIRTPLGAIMGFSDLALQADASKDDIQSYLTVIERNSGQVLRIIDDILDLAKVEANRVDLEIIEFSLTEFLADFSSLLGFRARENGITLNVRATTDLPEKIHADPTRLRQILTNAVGNAIKFTAQGHVTLSVSFDSPLLKFEIEDTGRGISAEQATNLFQAFVQADPSTTRKFGGTGLGLVLTKRLCQLMGGDYALEKSVIGVGSKFVATIQVKASDSAQLIAQSSVHFDNDEARSKNSQAGKLEGVRVLVVEDSPDNQNLVKLILGKQGAKLQIAKDGAEGLEKGLSEEFDVVVMDIQMPQMDGYEATKRLRDAGFAKPIIALTAHAMKEESERALRSGFTSFLSKPIQREALVSLIADLVKGT